MSEIEKNRIEKELLDSGDYYMLPNDMPLINNTFVMDFKIAECWGENGIRDTFKRVFNEWKKDIRYMTALCICLNDKVFEFAQKDITIAEVYHDLWAKCDSYILESKGRGTQNETFLNYDKDEVIYFMRATD